LLQAGEFVQILEHRQGSRIGCLEEIAYHNDWISRDELRDMANLYPKNPYCQYLGSLITE
jgi:glucose-1-phosphate thymidylyltransferase